MMQQLPVNVQQEVVFVKDATGREYKLLADQSQSHRVRYLYLPLISCQTLLTLYRQQFLAVLQTYFKDTKTDEILRSIITEEPYDFYTESQAGSFQLTQWGGVQ